MWRVATQPAGVNKRKLGGVPSRNAFFDDCLGGGSFRGPLWIEFFSQSPDPYPRKFRWTSDEGLQYQFGMYGKEEGNRPSSMLTGAYPYRPFMLYPGSVPNTEHPLILRSHLKRCLAPPKISLSANLHCVKVGVGSALSRS